MFYSLGFQEAANFGMFSLVCFHDLVVELQLFILSLVILSLFVVVSFGEF